MNKFEKQLEKWNSGTLRGAQAKLARLLKVSTATVALWATGKRRPSKGYASQMADLFDLDVYHFMRLFDAAITYPDAADPAKPQTLRDKENTDFTYMMPETVFQKNKRQSNSVCLPFFSAIPAFYPKYDESEVIEWWTIPRRCANGAKYLIRNQGAAQSRPNDLYLIKPANSLENGTLMLLKVGRLYLLRRVKVAKEGVILSWQDDTHPQTYKIKETLPLGLAVRKITDIE